MNFDQSSAVPVNDNAINTTTFDINSAKDEPQLQAATTPFTPTKYDATGVATEKASPISPISRVLRFFTQGNLLDAADEYKYAQDNAATKPQIVQGESIFHYASRLEPFYNDYSNKVMAQGVGKQLEFPMTVGLVAGAAANPVVTAGLLTRFMVLDHFLNGRMLTEKVAPDATPLVKDIAELGSFIVEGGVASEGYSAAKGFIMDKFVSEGKSPMVNIEPQQIAAIQDTPNMTKAQKSDLMQKTGITEEHVTASLNNNLPVQVPIDKMIDASQEPYWKKVENILVPEEAQAVNRVSIPEFKNTEEAAKFGATNGDNAEVVKNLKSTYAENLTQIQDIQKQSAAAADSGNMKLSDELDSQAFVMAQKNQLYREAYESATKTGGFKEPDTSLNTGKVKTSGLSQSIEVQAIKDGLTKDLGELPSYKGRDTEAIAAKVSEFINNDYELAKKIALGEAPEQDGLRQPELFTGIRIKAEAEGDVNTLRDLALSDKASALAVEAGQRVQALDTRTEDSPVAAIREVKKVRENATKAKTSAKEKASTVKAIQTEIKKARPKIEDWNSFIDSLEC